MPAASKEVNNWDVLKIMSERNMKIEMAPLDNIIRARAVKAGTQITIGVPGNRVGAILRGDVYVGGLILADKKEFDAVKAELEFQCPLVGCQTIGPHEHKIEGPVSANP